MAVNFGRFAIVFLALGAAPATARGLAIPSARHDGIETVKAWARDRVKDAARSFSGRRTASPAFWGGEIVYQIQIDRFNNGDLGNDPLNLPEVQVNETQGSDLYNIADYRQGGDLRGIIDRLDYMKDLGVSTLWLTPVFAHDGGYHGYCTTDFTRIDSGFGNNETFRELVREAHARDMRVVLDIVVNHMCDSRTTYSRRPAHNACARAHSDKHWAGIPGGNPAQGELGFSPAFFPPLAHQEFFNRCGANSTEEMQGTGPEAVFGDFVATMFDFDTRNYDFQEIFTELHKYWIAYADIDGFRVDAAKHVTEDFLAYFSTRIREYAASLGKDNFLLVGEVAGPSDWIGRRLGRMFSNPHNPDEHGHVPRSLTKRLHDLKQTYLAHPKFPFPGLSSVFDFAYGGRSRDALLGKSAVDAVSGHFDDGYFRDLAAQADPRNNWSILEIHDWPRFAETVAGNIWKSRLAVSFLGVTFGTPVYYYGIEQGFNGDCHFDKINAGAAEPHIKGLCKGHSHALYRQTMFHGSGWRLGSTVPAINALAYIGDWEPRPSAFWKDDPYLDRGHEVYRLARRLNYVRRSCPALRYGGFRYQWADAGRGLLAFSRIDEETPEAAKRELLVVINTSDTGQALPNRIPLSDRRGGITYRNLLNGFQTATTDGTALVFGADRELPGNSVMVWGDIGNVGEYEEALGAHRCKD